MRKFMDHVMLTTCFDAMSVQTYTVDRWSAVPVEFHCD